MTTKGQLIVICGIDGSGKTTLVESLKKNLGDSFVYTREPGGSPKAELIRDRLLGEEGQKLDDIERLKLFYEARAIHLQEKIYPAIEKGKIVICDRFDCCTFVYQKVNNTRLEPIFWSMREILVDPERLNITYVYLETSPGVAIKRKKQSENQNHFDSNVIKEIEKRIMDYYTFFEKSKARVIILNTNKRSKGEIFRQFLKINC